MTTVGVRHHEMFIDGRSVDALERYEIRHPATGEPVCTMAKGSPADADAAVAAARGAFERGAWSRATPEHRSEVMRRVADRLGTELEELTELEISCNGATVRQATGFHTGLAGPHFRLGPGQAHLVVSRDDGRGRTPGWRFRKSLGLRHQREGMRAAAQPIRPRTAWARGAGPPCSGLVLRAAAFAPSVAGGVRRPYSSSRCPTSVNPCEAAMDRIAASRAASSNSMTLPVSTSIRW